MRNAAAAGMIAVALSGCCGVSPECPPPPGYPAGQGVPAQPAAISHPNPIFIPVADVQCAWELVVDVVDDYFRIEREQPARIVGNLPTTGTLTSVAEVSPTIFEPWRRDTVDPEQRLENTLQSMHRQAIVHVTPAPAQGGHWVEVAVYKRLEDVAKPDLSPAGAATFRYDSTLTRVVNPVTGEQVTKHWISQGRDTSLEQSIIGDLLSRCGQPARPVVAPAPSAASAYRGAGAGR